MVQRIDKPYWVHWLHWHLYQRHRRSKAEARKVAWRFLNHIRTMPSGSLAVDGGANVGRITKAFRRAGFEVHAFEPDPVAREAFVARIGADPCVHLHASALGASRGKMTLYRWQGFVDRPVKATVGSSLIASENHLRDHSIEVDVVDFVEFVRSLPRRVDFVKLDVEGAELEILERLILEGLDREIGAIYAETHERNYGKEFAERTERLRRKIAERGIANIHLDWF